MRRRIYFDHAATSWPRLAGVADALAAFEQESSAAAGRGSHASAIQSGRIVEQVRAKLTRLVHAASSDEIAFFSNGTAANNYALAGVLASGDHVVTTAAEHNSVLRPLELLKKQRGISWNAVRVDECGRVAPEDIRNAITSKTRLVVISSASNVTGAIQEMSEIARIAKEHDVLMMVDGAQSLGYEPIDVQSLGIDLLASPGHKGLGGPLGTGVLYAARHLHGTWLPLWSGGTGELSDEVDGEFAWNAVAEAGNRNVTALAGWNVGLDRLSGNDHAVKMKLQRLVSILSRASAWQIIGHDSSSSYVPVVSVKCHGGAAGLQSPRDWAAVLDASFGIEARAGLHCAALIHSYLNTESEGGSLRFSIGHTTTDQDLDELESAVVQIEAMLVK